MDIEIGPPSHRSPQGADSLSTGVGGVEWQSIDDRVTILIIILSGGRELCNMGQMYRFCLPASPHTPTPPLWSCFCSGIDDVVCDRDTSAGDQEREIRIDGQARRTPRRRRNVVRLISHVFSRLRELNLRFILWVGGVSVSGIMEANIFVKFSKGNC